MEYCFVDYKYALVKGVSDKIKTISYEMKWPCFKVSDGVKEIVVC